jgi:hypothetical protein
MAAHRYKPGDKVPHTGLYLVTHQQHRADHEATLLEGEYFPSCLQCGAGVSFSLSRSAQPIGHDSDFKRAKARAHSRGHR